MLKVTLLPPNPLSKDVKTLWVIDRSCLIQESLGWKLRWFLEMNLLAEK